MSSLIVASYTFLIAAELWRERRKSLIRRWPAIFVPMLHGAIFLFPMVLASLSLDRGGLRSLSTGWVAVFAIEIVLYVVGAAFIVLVLAKDRTVHLYKTAASTDPLTGLLNRRGFFEAAAALMTANKTAMSTGERARFRPRSFQIDQRSIWAPYGRCHVGVVRDGGAQNHAGERCHRPVGRRGIRCDPVGHACRRHSGRGAGAIGLRSGDASRRTAIRSLRQ